MTETRQGSLPVVKALLTGGGAWVEGEGTVKGEAEAGWGGAVVCGCGWVGG